MKVFYKSKVAEIVTFIPNFKTIMLFGMIFTEHETLSEKTLKHEEVHVRQYGDVATLGASMGVVLMFVLFACGVQSWWMLLLLLLPLLGYYVWYGIDFAVQYVRTGDAKEAYRNIGFERQARWIAETWDRPCEEQNHYVSFGWM